MKVNVYWLLLLLLINVVRIIVKDVFILIFRILGVVRGLWVKFWVMVLVIVKEVFITIVRMVLGKCIV